MTDSEFSERQAVISEALSWHKTPYHHGQRCKGAGVDCAWFLADVFNGAGLIPRVEMEYYPPDWHIHKDDERYLRQVLQFAEKIETNSPLPGDVAMYKFGQCTAHGAIAIRWPRIIHALINVGVEIGEADADFLSSRFQGFYRLKRWL